MYGQSRSVAICTAFIMRSMKLNAEDALAFVSSKRKQAKVNAGFKLQLKSFE
jgi:protein-tyrosine phosphatase